jgi:hypothetical protein
MDKENIGALQNKQTPSIDFMMPKKMKKVDEKSKTSEQQHIQTYEFDEEKQLGTEIEEYTQLNIYKASKVASQRAIDEKTQFLKQLPLMNIEKVVMNSQSTSDFKDKLKKYFIVGVVVEKKVLVQYEKKNMKYPSLNKKSNCFIRFKISDLQKYKNSLCHKIQGLKSSKINKNSADSQK